MALGALADATRVDARPSNGLYAPKEEPKLSKFRMAVRLFTTTVATKPVLVACFIAFVVGGLTGVLVGMSSWLWREVQGGFEGPIGFLASAEMSSRALAALEGGQTQANLVLERVEAMGRQLERLERELRLSRQQAGPTTFAESDLEGARDAARGEDHAKGAVEAATTSSSSPPTPGGRTTASGPSRLLGGDAQEEATSSATSEAEPYSPRWLERVAAEARQRFARAAREFEAASFDPQNGGGPLRFDRLATPEPTIQGRRAEASAKAFLAAGDALRARGRLDKAALEYAKAARRDVGRVGLDARRGVAALSQDNSTAVWNAVDAALLADRVFGEPVVEDLELALERASSTKDATLVLRFLQVRSSSPGRVDPAWSFESAASLASRSRSLLLTTTRRAAESPQDSQHEELAALARRALRKLASLGDVRAATPCASTRLFHQRGDREAALVAAAAALASDDDDAGGSPEEDDDDDDEFACAPPVAPGFGGLWFDVATVALDDGDVPRARQALDALDALGFRHSMLPAMRADSEVLSRRSRDAVSSSSSSSTHRETALSNESPPSLVGLSGALDDDDDDQQETECDGGALCESAGRRRRRHSRFNAVVAETWADTAGLDRPRVPNDDDRSRPTPPRVPPLKQPASAPPSSTHPKPPVWGQAPPPRWMRRRRRSTEAVGAAPWE
mmetsp:Transcript_19775/g.78748  ORF Transcript_19775/g.78748 Transcript_19775/m.78748 type:complete len:681 (-) Transcript_19775:215-2257(-)